MRRHHHAAPPRPAPRAPRLRENGTSFEFSLCLSRACLGKIMHFIYKWRKKCRFLTRAPFNDQAALSRTRVLAQTTCLCKLVKHSTHRRLQKRHSFSAFPMFAPSLSWQTIGFLYKWRKRRFRTVFWRSASRSTKLFPVGPGVSRLQRGSGSHAAQLGFVQQPPLRSASAPSTIPSRDSRSSRWDANEIGQSSNIYTALHACVHTRPHDLAGKLLAETGGT